MSLRNFFLILSLAAFSGCGGTMISRSQAPFNRYPLQGFVLEWQTLEPGLAGDEFHVMVRPGETADIITFREKGGMERRSEKIGQAEEIFTNYAIFPTSDGFLFMQGNGTYREIQGKWLDYSLRSTDSEEVFPNSPYWSRESGPDKIWSSLLFIRKGPNSSERRAFVELEKTPSDPPASPPRIVREIPIPDGAQLFEHQGGYLCKADAPDGPEVSFRFFDQNMQEEENRLASGLNALAKAGKLGEEQWSSPWESWALLRMKKPKPPKGDPEAKYSGLYFAAFADTILGHEVLCEGHPLFDSEEDLDKDNLVISPSHNLFVVLAPHGEDSLHFYLGAVRRREKGWGTEVYRVRTFEKFHNCSPKFSRDGNSIVFMTSDASSQPEVVHVYISDIIADVNRRYPEAKLDLEALKAEVK